MKSCTHYPVAAPRSLFVGASLHRPYYLTGQPVLFPFMLLVGLLLLAGSVQAQYSFPTVGTIGNLSSLDAGDRSTPVLVDLNRDGKLDIVTGNADGL
ncbi:MAG: hypothetical protein LH618_15350, partial [Saprospiraceae bacterium]|nr:hypothetical protein [Saprospiraceae bacterium]